MHNFPLSTTTLLNQSNLIIFGKCLFLTIVLFILYELFKFYLETRKPIDELIKEQWRCDIYEAYLRAVRNGHFNKILNEEDIELIAMEESEFTMRMLELRNGNLDLLEIHKSDNMMRIVQAEKKVGWKEIKRTDDYGEWELKHSATPPPDAKGANLLGIRSKLKKNLELQ